ncbi:4Fe-4S binding protein, partial [Myxococcota bacterium]|nr:4Fe-4S binding protein [Myxococcota bacterium]
TPLVSLSAVDCQSRGLGAAQTVWSDVARALGVCALPPVVGAPWAIELFGLELVDPLAFVGAALAGGPSLHLVLGALIPLALVAALGRFFCGWICPYVPILAVSNATRALAARVGVDLPDLALPRGSARAVLVAIVAATAISGSQLAALFYPPSVVAREVFKVIFLGGLGAGAAVILAIFALDTFVARAGFCRHVCPGGALFALVGARSPLVIRRDAARCTDCTACDVVCNLGQSPMTDHLDAGCERCGKCVAACPTDALALTTHGLVTIGATKHARAGAKPGVEEAA